MSSEDVLPTYAEAMKMHQTPWHIIEEETLHLTFNETSATSKIKSFISRTESASQHGVYMGAKPKNKIIVFIENMLTGKHRPRDVSQSKQNTDPFLQLELRRSTTHRSLGRQKDSKTQEAHWRQHQKTPYDSAEPSDIKARSLAAAFPPSLL